VVQEAVDLSSLVRDQGVVDLSLIIIKVQLFSSCRYGICGKPTWRHEGRHLTRSPLMPSCWRWTQKSSSVLAHCLVGLRLSEFRKRKEHLNLKVVLQSTASALKSYGLKPGNHTQSGFDADADNAHVDVLLLLCVGPQPLGLTSSLRLQNMQYVRNHLCL
jgi:hypothetical protein